MDSSGKSVRNNALRTTQRRGPKIAPRVVKPNTAALTRKNNVEIQATQPLVQKIILPDIEEQNNVALPLHERENVVEAVRNSEQEQLVDHKIVLSDAVEEQSVPITSIPIRISKGPTIAPKKVASSVAAPSVINGVNKSKQEIAPRPEEMDDNDTNPAQTAVLSNNHKEETCLQLYDPCTREPISNLQELEKRIRELKKQRNTTPIGLYGLTNDTSNYDFLINVFLNPDISLEEMVSFRLSDGGQIGSDIFEVLSRFFVLFGGIEHVNPRQGGNYKFMKKIEGNVPEIYNDSMDALKRMKCKATRVMGISDITLVNVRKDKQVIKPDSPYCEVECDTKEKEQVTTYVMSVKWYKEEKNAEHYDLEKLFTAAHRIVTAEQKPIDIIVFLKSKREFHIAHNRAARQYVRELANTYFGWEEDVKPFLESIRSKLFESAKIIEITPQEAFDLEYGRADSKPTLSLQLHQDIIVKGVCDQIEEQVDPLYLIGVLPRGGKTFIAGGIIREYVRRTKSTNINVFWLTAAPNETMSQVHNELVAKFQDFEDFEFIEVKTNTDFNKKRPNTVFFCSTQLLIAAQKPSSRKREYLHQLLTAKEHLGLVFFDEAHKTGTGDTTKGEIQTIIDTYRQDNLPFIFLTATYYNILIDYQIQKSNTFIWDYTDVLATRSLATTTEQAAAIENLRIRFGESLVNSVIKYRQSNGEALETMAKAYIGFPDLYFISADFQEEALHRFEAQQAYRPDQGFTLSTIFAIHPNTTITDIKTAENKIRKDAYRIFVNLINPKNLISLITPRDTFDQPDILEVEGGEPLVKEQGSTLEPSILGRINAMSRDAQSRFRLDQQPTLLMFMPTGGQGTNIYYLLCAWASLLLTHTWWRENYEIACVVEEENVARERAESEVESSNGIHMISKNPKSSILALERRLHCQEHSRGLLILAGEKLSMGVSLPCTDVVFLLNEKKSPDDIIQKMYRALTPSPGKHSAFIVDLNPVRTLAALYGYTRASHESSNTSSEILDIIYDSYSWDADIFEYHLRKGADARPLSFQDKLREMYERAEREPEYRIHDDIGGLEKKLTENIRKEMDFDMIRQLKGQMGSKRTHTAIERLGLQDGSKVTLESGKLVIRKPTEPIKLNESDEKRDDSMDTVEIIIGNFIETVIDFIKYIAITSTADTLEHALEEYESNQPNIHNATLKHNVLHMIHSRTEIQTGSNKELLSSILIATVKSTIQSSERIFRQMKGKVDERSVRKDKILAIIHKRLTPREKQKKDHGEVFTPIEMIENMLSHLPNADWSNPNLTWLDPANGIGNFPVVVFYKLDEGLKKWEPNENKRRKHIIENMIFMMELQSNNNRIARNIFTSLCDHCTPNIWTVDTLKASNEMIHTHFKVKQFDRIIGNPPFQAFQDAEGKRGGGDELYMKFVKKSLELLTPNGYLVFVHPPSWRKPEYSDGQKKSKNAGMFTLMAHEHQMVYLEIHNAKDGMRDFKAGTRYDCYVIKKTEATQETIINDETRTEVKADLRDFEFLPNFNIKNVLKLLPKRSESACELGEFDDKAGEYANRPCVLYERSAYGSDKGWVTAKESSSYQYPLVHSTLKDGTRFLYSNRNDKGMFGISKVIFGESGVNSPVIDMEGKYGMSQGAMAIVVKSKAEATRLSTFLQSNFFKNILSSCMWGGFRIDWRLFTYFKDNFWETAVPLNEAIISNQVDEPEVKNGGKRFNKTRKHRKN